MVQTQHLASAFSGFDWAYDYGYMWGLNNGVLYQTNLATGQVLQQSVAALAGPASQQQFNAAWAFANGDLGFLGASDSTFYRITVRPGPLTSASVLALQADSIPGGNAGINDGASCAPPDQPISVSGTSLTATEGSSMTATVASVTDPDSGARASDYSATIDWGDGSTSTGQITGPTGGPFAVGGTHTYVEEGNYTVTVTVTDIDNVHNSANATSKAQVADAALNAACAAPNVSRQSFTSATATFTDADPNGTTSDYGATINWGDGSSSPGAVSAGTGPGPYTVTGSHAYATTGSFTITTTVTDAGGSRAPPPARRWCMRLRLVEARS